MNIRMIFATAALLPLALPVVASAQASNDAFQRGNNISVLERPRPDYDALGVRSGTFLFYPKLNLGVTSDDNIYALPTNTKSDEIFNAEAQLSVVTDWTRNAMRLFGSVNRQEYSKYDTESTTNYTVGANGRLDVTRDNIITGGVQFDHLTEARNAPGAPNTTAKPVEYDLTQVNLAGSHSFNRIRLAARFDTQSFSYENGVDTLGATVFQDYRNHTSYAESVRADYAISPNTAVFVEGRLIQDKFDLTPPNPRISYDSDSDDADVTVGVDLDFAAVLKGKVQVGYLDHTFADKRFSDVSGLSMRGEMQWYPTRLTTVTFRVGRQVSNSGIVQSPAYLSTTGGVEVDHELLRNIILSGRVDYANDDYSGISRQDDRWSGNLSATYLLNRRMGVKVGYTYLDQSSSGSNVGPEYTINRFSIGLLLQY